MLRSIALCSLLGVASLGFSQEPPIERRKAAFRVLFNFDFRSTYVNASPVRFYGFRLGAQRGKDILAVGFYGLGDPYIQPAAPIPDVGERELVTDFDYMALTYERLFVDTRRWHIGVPISVGLGQYRRSYRGDKDRIIPYGTNEIVPIEALAHVDYDIFRWLFVGVGAGYRHVFAADHAATKTLSDWTYFSKVGIRLGHLLKRKKPKNTP